MSNINSDYPKMELYKNISVPSYTNGYSLGIEYMRNWFLSHFDKNFFKTVHIYGKYILDDYTRYDIGEYVKREKPAVVITPSVDFDHNRDNIDLYAFGEGLFAKRTSAHNAFFKDYNNKLYLGIGMRDLKMVFVFRIRVSTRAEQLDLYQNMELKFRIGATQGQDVDMDFHIPNDIIINLADQAGFEIDNLSNTIKSPKKFLKYLNTYSDIPFLYRLRKINQKYEFFLRMNNLYVHIDTRDKLSMDDGDQEGHLFNNFTIEMNAILNIPIPHYYVLFTKRQCSYTNIKIESNSNDYGLYSIKQVIIPETNHNGWGQYVTMQYLPDKSADKITFIDIKDLFDEDPIGEIVKDCMDTYISPSIFIDINVYTNDIAKDNGKCIKTYTNWELNQIEIKEDIINSMLYIVIYVDRLYMNEHLLLLHKKDYKDRIERPKEDE